jgi:hypothetical protein
MYMHIRKWKWKGQLTAETTLSRATPSSSSSPSILDPRSIFHVLFSLCTCFSVSARAFQSLPCFSVSARAFQPLHVLFTPRNSFDRGAAPSPTLGTPPSCRPCRPLPSPSPPSCSSSWLSSTAPSLCAPGCPLSLPGLALGTLCLTTPTSSLCHLQPPLNNPSSIHYSPLPLQI